MNHQVPGFAGRPVVHPFTAQDFYRMMEAGAFSDMRVELVRGELQKMLPGFLNHGEYNLGVGAKLIGAYREAGLRVGADVIVEIDGKTVRAVDVAVVTSDTPPNEAATGKQIVLAVEIANTTLARDLGEKALDYARAGIANYWVVDLNARATHVMRLGASGRYDSEIVRFSEDLGVPGTDRTITID